MSNLYQVKKDIVKGFLRFNSKHIDYDVTHSNGLKSFFLFFKRGTETIIPLEFTLKEKSDRTPLESNNILVSLHGKTRDYSYSPNKDNIEVFTEAVDLDFNIVDYFIKDYVSIRQ